jgi:hypothetical protein
MGKWVAGSRISVRERRVRGMVRVRVGSIMLLIGFVSDGLCEVVISLFVAGWCNMTREIFGYEMERIGWDKEKGIVCKRRRIAWMNQCARQRQMVSLYNVELSHEILLV